MWWLTRQWVVWRYLAWAISPPLQPELPKINEIYFPNSPRIEGVHLMWVMYIDLNIMQFLSRGFPPHSFPKQPHLTPRTCYIKGRIRYIRRNVQEAYVVGGDFMNTHIQSSHAFGFQRKLLRRGGWLIVSWVFLPLRVVQMLLHTSLLQWAHGTSCVGVFTSQLSLSLTRDLIHTLYLRICYYCWTRHFTSPIMLSTAVISLISVWDRRSSNHGVILLQLKGLTFLCLKLATLYTAWATDQ
jgi:hypothetical protein